MNPSEIAERAARFYKENATNVVNVPRPGHPEDKSGWDGVRRASEARFVAPDALVMTLADAFDFAAKFVERAIEESRGQPSVKVSSVAEIERRAKLFALGIGDCIDHLPQMKEPQERYRFLVERLLSFAGSIIKTALPDPPKGNENV